MDTKKIITDAVSHNELETAWRAAPAKAVLLAKMAKDTFTFVRKNRHQLISDEPDNERIWYNPEIQVLFFSPGTKSNLMKLANWKNTLSKAPKTEWMEYSWEEGPDNSKGPWIKFNFFRPAQIFNKKADGTIETPKPQPILNIEPLKTMGQAAGYVDGPIARILGGPSPLSAMLASGLLGAGLGYGTGMIMENVSPKKYIDSGRLRKTLGLTGALAGASIPAWLMSAYHREGLPFYGPVWAKEACEALDEEIPPNCQLSEEFSKAAAKAIVNEADWYPTLNVDKFNQVIWSDDDRYTPVDLRAATTGIVDSASTVKGSPWVSPMDIAKIGLGAGSGFLSASLVGKTLGALAGLAPEAQQKLQQVGIWAGVLKNTVPLILQ